MSVNASDYATLSRLIETHCGIEIGPEKEYLYLSRLQPLVASLGLANIAGLVSQLRQNPPKELVTKVIEAMTTHESLFFRDRAPFDVLQRTILPSLLQRTGVKKHIRILSAACSTGQEPYSIAMTLIESALPPGWTYEILAIDISGPVIEKARLGVFSDFETKRGCSQEILTKFFSPTAGGWRVNDEVRRHITFKQQNLLEMATTGPAYDVVFCRNVLIYFSTETKRKVLEHLEAIMGPHAFLLLGGTESAYGCSEAFVYLEGSAAGVYRKRTAA